MPQPRHVTPAHLPAHVAGAVLILSPATAAAYLDPGTGSILLQGLLAAVAAVAATAGLYWRRIKGALSALFNRERTPTVDGDQGAADADSERPRQSSRD